MNLIRDAKGNAQKCPCVQLHTGGNLLKRKNKLRR
nr:MAG TPA: hypothetical protein [Caudoviricetes sp.]